VCEVGKGGRRGAQHLDGERLEAHQAESSISFADRHVQRGIARGAGRERVGEVREVLHLGVELEVEICV